MTATAQTEKLTAKTAGIATLKFAWTLMKFVWKVVKFLFAPVRWIYGLLAVPKGQKKPMTLSGKILMLTFCWGFTWFVTGFNGAAFLDSLSMIWDAFWAGRLTW